MVDRLRWCSLRIKDISDRMGRCLKSSPRGPFHSSRRLRIHRWSLVPETLWTLPFTVTSNIVSKDGMGSGSRITCSFAFVTKRCAASYVLSASTSKLYRFPVLSVTGFGAVLHPRDRLVNVLDCPQPEPGEGETGTQAAHKCSGDQDLLGI